MNEPLFNEEMNLLKKALQQKSFHFVIIGYNHPDVYGDVSEWLSLHLPERVIQELRFSFKSYREIMDELNAAGQNVVTIPDFDWLFNPENESICVALNQRRDYLARKKLNLLCFIPSTKFKLLPVRIPDLWSLRSLELDFAYALQEEKFPTESRTITKSSFGGSTIPEKEAEVRRLKYQISQTDKNNTALLQSLKSQLVTLQIELPPRQASEEFEIKASAGVQKPKEIITITGISGDRIDLSRERPETILDATPDLSNLEEGEKALLSVFALLPAEPVAFATLDELLPGTENLDKTLLTLAKKGWIEFNKQNNSFRCSPVVQEVTRLQNREKLFEHCKLLIATLVEKLAYKPGTGHFTNATYQEAALFAHYAESILQAISKADYQLASLAERVGNFHNTLGNLDKALAYFEQDRRLTEELCEAEPQNVAFKNGLAISYQHLGNTHAALGDIEKALAFYKQDAQLSEKLYKAYPQNVNFKNGLALSYERLGESHAALGNIEKALAYFEQDRRLTEELCEAEPQNIAFKNGLAISYQHLGNTHTALGNLDMALTYYEQDRRLIEELYKDYPQNIDVKNNLAISYQYLGSTHTALGNLDMALTYYEQDRRLIEELNKDYPQNIDFKNGLAISYSKLGVTHAALDNHDKALTYYEQDRRLTEELYKDYPQNVAFKKGLAISYQNLGNSHSALGNLDKALTFYENYSRLTEELYKDYPQNVDFKNGLAVSYAKLGVFFRDRSGESAKARSYFEQAEARWAELVESYPAYAEFQNNWRWINRQLDALQ